MSTAWIFGLQGWDTITDPLPKLSSFSTEEAREALLEAGYFADASWSSTNPAWHGTGNRLSVALYSADPTTLQQPPFPFLVRIGTAFRWWTVYTRDLPSALEALQRALALIDGPPRGDVQPRSVTAIPSEVKRELAHAAELIQELRHQRDQLERQLEAQRRLLDAAHEERAELRRLLECATREAMGVRQ